MRYYGNPEIRQKATKPRRLATNLPRPEPPYMLTGFGREGDLMNAMAMERYRAELRQWESEQ